jgi:hypothetical protein
MDLRFKLDQHLQQTKDQWTQQHHQRSLSNKMLQNRQRNKTRPPGVNHLWAGKSQPPSESLWAGDQPSGANLKAGKQPPSESLRVVSHLAGENQTGAKRCSGYPNQKSGVIKRDPFVPIRNGSKKKQNQQKRFNYKSQMAKFRLQFKNRNQPRYQAI